MSFQIILWIIVISLVIYGITWLWEHKFIGGILIIAVIGLFMLRGESSKKPLLIPLIIFIGSYGLIFLMQQLAEKLRQNNRENLQKWFRKHGQNLGQIRTNTYGRLILQLQIPDEFKQSSYPDSQTYIDILTREIVFMDIALANNVKATIYEYMRTKVTAEIEDINQDLRSLYTECTRVRSLDTIFSDSIEQLLNEHKLEPTIPNQSHSVKCVGVFQGDNYTEEPIDLGLD